MKVTLIGGSADGVVIDRPNFSPIVIRPALKVKNLFERLPTEVVVEEPDDYEIARWWAVYPIPGWDFIIDYDVSRDEYTPYWTVKRMSTSGRKKMVNAALNVLGHAVFGLEDARLYSPDNRVLNSIRQSAVDRAVDEVRELTAA